MLKYFSCIWKSDLWLLLHANPDRIVFKTKFSAFAKWPPLTCNTANSSLVFEEKVPVHSIRSTIPSSAGPFKAVKPHVGELVNHALKLYWVLIKLFFFQQTNTVTFPPAGLLCMTLRWSLHWLNIDNRPSNPIRNENGSDQAVIKPTETLLFTLSDMITRLDSLIFGCYKWGS